MASLASSSFFTTIPLILIFIGGINVCTGIYDPEMFIPQSLPIVDKFDTVDTTTNLRAKRFFIDQRHQWNADQILEAILCVFIPPAAVLIHGGHDMLLHMVINIVLWICGWLPGMIHAFWYCFYRID